jgi:hypothetical protein
MSEPMVDALLYLSSEFSVDRDEWRQHHKGGDCLLDGLMAHGYARTKGGRYAVSEAGRRMLAANEPVGTEG